MGTSSSSLIIIEMMEEGRREEYFTRAADTTDVSKVKKGKGKVWYVQVSSRSRVYYASVTRHNTL